MDSIPGDPTPGSTFCLAPPLYMTTPPHPTPLPPRRRGHACAPVERLERADRHSARAVPAGPEQQVPALGVALQEQLSLQPAHFQEAPRAGRVTNQDRPRPQRHSHALPT